MQISHCVYPEVQEESVFWGVEDTGWAHIKATCEAKGV